jgi:hypothetical protein
MNTSRQPPIAPRKPSSATDTGRARPEVIVEFLFDRGLLSVAVRNIGDRPAIRVTVTFDKKIIGLGGKSEISGLPLFRNIEFIGPGREIVTLVDSSGSYFQRKQPTKISAKISFSDPEKRKYESTIKHDLEIYRGLTYLVPPGPSSNSSDCDF